MVCLNILSVCLSIEIRKKIKQTNLRRIWIGEKQKHSMKRESRRNKNQRINFEEKNRDFFSQNSLEKKMQKQKNKIR